jgi:SAM-dependent methyltransferase
MVSVMSAPGDERNMDKAARCGEPSYVWRAGQQRRLQLILAAAGERIKGRVLENGCGVGMYLEHLSPHAGELIGLEYDLERASEAHQRSDAVICAAGEHLPFPEHSFDLVLSHEVLEHVQDDRTAIQEMVRVLYPGGRIVIFVPNRGYPFETHGVYWRGRYHFGNIPLVNYLPRKIRNRLAPHVRVYTRNDLAALFQDLPVDIHAARILFGAYDNIIARWPVVGRTLRGILLRIERTPLCVLGLSHFWVVEKYSGADSAWRKS